MVGEVGVIGWGDWLPRKLVGWVSVYFDGTFGRDYYTK